MLQGLSVVLPAPISPGGADARRVGCSDAGPRRNSDGDRDRVCVGVLRHQVSQLNILAAHRQSSRRIVCTTVLKLASGRGLTSLRRSAVSSWTALRPPSVSPSRRTSCRNGALRLSMSATSDMLDSMIDAESPVQPAKQKQILRIDLAPEYQGHYPLRLPKRLPRAMNSSFDRDHLRLSRAAPQGIPPIGAPGGASCLRRSVRLRLLGTDHHAGCAAGLITAQALVRERRGA